MKRNSIMLSCLDSLVLIVICPEVIALSSAYCNKKENWLNVGFKANHNGEQKPKLKWDDAFNWISSTSQKRCLK